MQRKNANLLSVTNLELSKEIHRLGVRRQSVFYWELGERFGSKKKIHLVTHEERKSGGEWTYYPAYTATEIGKMLSANFNEWSQGWDDSGCIWKFQFGERGCGSMIQGFGRNFYATEMEDDWENSEANARACLLIHLLLERIIEPQTV